MGARGQLGRGQTLTLPKYCRPVGLEGVEAEELAILPGMDEIFSLVRMKRHYDEGEYDVLIIDSAPTGTALRLLSLPEVAGLVYAQALQALPGGVGSPAAPLVEPLFRPVAGVLHYPPPR